VSESNSAQAFGSPANQDGQAALRFSGKARTLESLSATLRTARLLPQVIVTSAQLSESQDLPVLVEDACGPGPYIVRSSSTFEDSSESSNAGAYLSRGHVHTAELAKAISDVLATYSPLDSSGEALVQPMLLDSIASGVALSHDQGTGSPYRTISWHEGSDTSIVTSGRSGVSTWREAANTIRQVDAPWPVPLVRPVLEELFSLFGLPIDIEFAITRGAEGPEIWLLQVRQLHLPGDPGDRALQEERLTRLAAFVDNRLKAKPFIAGQSSALGVMPDWNPAEMIGIQPRPLALSLYRDLITDSVWAYQRHNYGYRNLRGNPLLISLDGQPYVDVRLSMNSFVPAALDTELASKLVDYYMAQLVSRPELHDKIEFEVVFSCYTLDLQTRLKSLLEHGFSESELLDISGALRDLTNQVIHPDEGLWRSDAARLEVLAQRQTVTAASRSPALERLYWTVEDIRRYGTLPFAGLARAAFIGVQMLRSLASTGVISQREEEQFLLGLSTIGKQVAVDRAGLKREQFLSIYGHLRPGTYDILSSRYDAEPDRYFDWTGSETAEPELMMETPFSLSLEQLLQLRSLLGRQGLEIDPVDLLFFIKKAIELREWGKFEFTRALSYAIELISEIGSEYGFTRDDMSYCSLPELLSLHSSAASVPLAISRSVEAGRRSYEETKSLSLPPLIVSPADVWGFRQPEVQPNFVTGKRVIGPVTTAHDRKSIPGSVVVIESADPGYDWVFSHQPAGLITAWGGANSHMAIRAAEVGLPAAIGVGPEQFALLNSATRVLLDAGSGRIEVID
jgi:phosphohistidine swiveling domain-containing protein